MSKQGRFVGKMTPGPWRVAEMQHPQIEGFGVWSERGDLVAVTGAAIESDAVNAHLIAASPDLLAALIACESMGYTAEWVAMRNAAIAKATTEPAHAD